MARYRFLLNFFAFGLVSSLLVSGMTATAAPVDDLNQIFGDPDQFVTNFQASIEDKSNEIVGLFLAATGFTLAVRSFLS